MDTIILAGIRALGAHGVLPEEQTRPQPFEVDIELHADLRAAGSRDEIEETIDYRPVFDICRQVIEDSSYRLLEAIAETIAHDVLAATPSSEIVVRVRKLRVPLPGQVAYAAVEIKRFGSLPG